MGWEAKGVAKNESVGWYRKSISVHQTRFQHGFTPGEHTLKGDEGKRGRARYGGSSFLETSAFPPLPPKAKPDDESQVQSTPTHCHWATLSLSHSGSLIPQSSDT